MGAMINNINNDKQDKGIGRGRGKGGFKKKETSYNVYT